MLLLAAASFLGAACLTIVSIFLNFGPKNRAAREANGGRHTTWWWFSMTVGLVDCSYFWVWRHLSSPGQIASAVVACACVALVIYFRPWSAANRVPQRFRAKPYALSSDTQAWLAGDPPPETEDIESR